MSADHPSLVVVLCTYNRSALLAGALEALCSQSADPLSYEIIVVDNNSTDQTADIVNACCDRRVRVRCIRETRQGLAYARNAGIAATDAELIAFTDDDVRVAPDWIASLQRLAHLHPDAQWFGGKVLPLWPTPPPTWLTSDCWSPLALVDYGEQPLVTDMMSRRCLVGANLAVRRVVFDLVGGFHPTVQRVADAVGSTEDHELQIRMWGAGLAGLYSPALVVFAPVQQERLERTYHRRWHVGHGRFYALMRDPAFEPSRRLRLLGVPGHVYRGIATHAIRAIASALAGEEPEAFRHELHARFLAGFVRQRLFEPPSPQQIPAADRLPLDARVN